MGSVGMLAFLYLVYSFFVMFYRFKRRLGDDFPKDFAYGAIGAMIVVLLSGVFNTSLHHESAMAFTLIIGLFAAYASSLPLQAYGEH